MSDLGYIDDDAAAALGVTAGPIRLLAGIPGANGFGEAHITSHSSRMKQLNGLGYPTAIAFVSDVARNWTKIALGDKGRLILIHPKQGYDLRIIVVLKPPSDGAPFWSVITAIPSRVERSPVVYER